MPAKNINNALQKLHASLETIEKPDQELLTLLKQLDDDIQRILTENPQNTDSPASMLADQLGNIGARFATDHPQLAPILQELADTLGKMGI